MNELVQMSTEISGYSFKDKKLQSLTNKAAKIADNLRKCSFEVCAILGEVQTSKCYQKDGFENMTDYATKVLGISKSVAYSMAKIGITYMEKGTVTVPAPDGKSWSVTQLAEAARMGENVIDAAKNGDINPDMTCADIRDYVDSHRPEKEKKTTVTTEKRFSGIIKGKNGVASFKEKTADEIKKMLPTARVITEKTFKGEDGKKRTFYEYATDIALVTFEK